MSERTPDEIKKGLEYCTKPECDGCPYDGQNLYCGEEKNKDALAYIQRLEAKVPNWISVEDELPEKGVDVLYVSKCDGRIHLGRWRNKTDRGAIYFMNGNRMETATHWMPLPELPKEEVWTKIRFGVS